MNMMPRLVATTLACTLAACSPSRGSEEPDTDAAATQSAAATTDDASARDVTSSAPATGPSRASARVLTLEGLGDLVIGKPIPAGSKFAERGAQINETCRTVTSPEFPGVYAIVEGGEVRRITVGDGSDVKLVEGVGVGATERDVLRAFPGFRSSPHKYVAAPGKYLTQPGNEPRLRFEIGENGRVTLIHAGLMPQLGYVEGCA